MRSPFKNQGVIRRTTFCNYVDLQQEDTKPKSNGFSSHLNDSHRTDEQKISADAHHHIRRYFRKLTKSAQVWGWMNRRVPNERNRETGGLLSGKFYLAIRMRVILVRRKPNNLVSNLILHCACNRRKQCNEPLHLSYSLTAVTSVEWTFVSQAYLLYLVG